MINKHKQKGAETVEFAMIALLFFAVTVCHHRVQQGFVCLECIDRSNPQRREDGGHLSL